MMKSVITSTLAALLFTSVVDAKPADNDKMAFVFQLTRHGARASLQKYGQYGFKVPLG